MVPRGRQAMFDFIGDKPLFWLLLTLIWSLFLIISMLNLDKKGQIYFIWFTLCLQCGLSYFEEKSLGFDMKDGFGIHYKEEQRSNEAPGVKGKETWKSAQPCNARHSHAVVAEAEHRQPATSHDHAWAHGPSCVEARSCATAVFVTKSISRPFFGGFFCCSLRESTFLGDF